MLKTCVFTIVIGGATGIGWGLLLAAPWRPWGTRERLEVHGERLADLNAVGVLIPARDEA